MQGKMKAVLKAEAAPGAKVALVDIPPIGPCDVLVQVKAASICGTDMHIYEWDGWAQSRMSVPRIFGHEFAGEVVEVGSEVTSLVTSAVPGRPMSVETYRYWALIAMERLQSTSLFLKKLPGRQAKKLIIVLPQFKNPLVMLFMPHLRAKLRTRL